MRFLLCSASFVVLSWAGTAQKAAPRAANCRRIVLDGEATAGQEWKSAIGEGWVFRVVPIQPGQAGYSGWDLVVDRVQPAGFPDALLLATPPFHSINQREVGTTFGLRAQDAIGWNPRSFRMLTDPGALRESQKLFQVLGDARQRSTAAAAVDDEGKAMQRLLSIGRRSSAGQFRILDARLSLGIADAAPFAQNWALASFRTPHQVEAPASGKPTLLGELHWIRFAITLWLPDTWKTPKDIHAPRVACAE